MAKWELPTTTLERINTFACDVLIEFSALENDTDFISKLE